MTLSRRRFLQITSAGVLSTYAGHLGNRALPSTGTGPDFSHLPRSFRVLINADSHVGPVHVTSGNMGVFNRMLEEFVAEGNALDPLPAFTVFDGDLTHNPTPASFEYFVRCLERLKGAKVLVHGNHDGRAGDPNFEMTQQRLCGYSGLMYSFDAGDWHFVAVPSHQMFHDEDDEQAYLEWLRKDLESHSARPTMVFQHYHTMPLGTSQLEFYGMNMDYKRQVIDALTNHGNVKYVLSGHVHHGIKASEKISWIYRGVKFLLMPTQVYPRPFGEEYPEFLPQGERNCGYYSIMDIDGKDVQFTGRKLQNDSERILYENLQEWRDEYDLRAIMVVGAMPKGDILRNGTFSRGLANWEAPFRYTREEDPVYIARHETTDERDTAWIRVKHPGTTWWFNDEFHEIYQVVDRPAEMVSLVLRASYKIPSEKRPPLGGGFIRTALYSGEERRLLVFFHWGAREHRLRYMAQCIGYIDDGQGRIMNNWMRQQARGRIVHVRVPDPPSQWCNLTANLRDIYDFAEPGPRRFDSAGIDRVLIAAGTWIGNELEAESAAYFTDFDLRDDQHSGISVNEASISMSDKFFDPVYGVVNYQGGR